VRVHTHPHTHTHTHTQLLKRSRFSAAALIVLAMLMLAGCGTSSQRGGGAPHQSASGTGFGGNGSPDGGGESLLGGPGSAYDEQAPESVVPFTDPRSGLTYDVIDGRVIIAFKNPPHLPTMNPNYFDSPLPSNGIYRQQFDLLVDCNIETGSILMSYAGHYETECKRAA
jgi:hypothetical protein